MENHLLNVLIMTVPNFLDRRMPALCSSYKGGGGGEFKFKEV